MSGPPGPVFDAGLQAERTALAWRRTALSVAVAAVAAERLAAPALGALSLVVAGAGLAQAVVVAEISWRRYRVVHRSLTRRGDLTGVRTAGLPMAALACSGLLVGVLALAFVLAG
ncbi:DUF202 domain-containing protein [Geodermatophilus sp. SYSU D00758]